MGTRSSNLVNRVNCVVFFIIGVETNLDGTFAFVCDHDWAGKSVFSDFVEAFVVSTVVESFNFSFHSRLNVKRYWASFLLYCYVFFELVVIQYLIYECLKTSFPSFEQTMTLKFFKFTFTCRKGLLWKIKYITILRLYKDENMYKNQLVP